MLYKHIPGSSLGGNVMTQEQSILKEMLRNTYILGVKSGSIS